VIVYCPECGHQNPSGNKFCGMCGDSLPQRPANSEKRPTAEMRTEDIARAADRQERIAEHDPEPVPANLRHREPEDAVVREMPPLNEYSAVPDAVPLDAPVERHAPLPPAVADFYASRPTAE